MEKDTGAKRNVSAIGGDSEKIMRIGGSIRSDAGDFVEIDESNSEDDSSKHNVRSERKLSTDTEHKGKGEGRKRREVKVKKGHRSEEIESNTDEVTSTPEKPVPKKRKESLVKHPYPKQSKGKLSSSGATDSGGSGSEARKKRRKSRQSVDSPSLVPQTVITAELKDLQEDVVDAGEDVTSGSGDATVPDTSQSQSQPTSKIYVQQKTGFVAKSREKALKTHISDPDTQASLGSMTAVDIALLVQRKFQLLATFCHGLLAGLALWHVIVVYTSHSVYRFSYVSFVAEYSYLARPFQTVFYLLTVICIISVLDRYDVAQMETTNIPCLIKLLRPGVLTVVLYVLALILTLCATHTDDKMALYFYNDTLWLTESMVVEEQRIQNWINLNVCRCVAVILAWLVMSLSSVPGRLYDHIESLKRKKSQRTCSEP